MVGQRLKNYLIDFARGQKQGQEMGVREVLNTVRLILTTDYSDKEKIDLLKKYVEKS